jgi:hypothetical protein
MRIIPDNAIKESEVFELSSKDIDTIYISYCLLPDEIQKLKYDNKFSNFFTILVALKQISIRNY